MRCVINGLSSPHETGFFERDIALVRVIADGEGLPYEVFKTILMCLVKDTMLPKLMDGAE